MSDIKPVKPEPSAANGDEPKPDATEGNLVKSHMSSIKQRLEAIPDFSFSSDEAGDAYKKFTGRCRLFFGNLPPMLTEEQFIELISPFGEYEGLFLQAKKGFGFVKLETRAAADICKVVLDGNLYYGKPIRVRFATQSAALLVKHLPLHCTNELLEKAFSEFGEVERAVVVVDDRGKSTGNGIVEFANKQSFTQAIDAVAAGVFLLTKTLRPVEVEPLEQRDEEDGKPAKYVVAAPESTEELSVEPRFANAGSIDYEIGMRWKKLDQSEREKRKKLEEELTQMKGDLETEIAAIIADEKTAKLRADLERRQAELKALEEQQAKKKQELEDLARKVAGVKQAPTNSSTNTAISVAQKNVQLKSTPVKSIPSLTDSKTNTKVTPLCQPPRPATRFNAPGSFDNRNRANASQSSTPRPKATIVTHQVSPQRPRFQVASSINNKNMVGQQQQQQQSMMNMQNALRAMSNMSNMNNGMSSNMQRNNMNDNMNQMRMNSPNNQPNLMNRMGMNNQINNMGGGGGGVNRPALLQGQPQRGALLNRPALLQQPNQNQMMNNMLRQQMMQATAGSPNMGGGPPNKRFRQF